MKIEIRYFAIGLMSIILWSLTYLLYGGSMDTIDNSIYAKLLHLYVKDGRVDYQGFKNRETELDQYLKVLENVDSGRLSHNHRFAFYINAYNAWTIKLILSAYPEISSIKELGSLFKSPWEKEICRIDGKKMSLDDIEHGILRPHFKDTRIHFAVNCASKSCPPLRSEPYEGDRLEEQLDEMTEAFINDPQNNSIKNNTLYVSRIFKWYGEDFDNDLIGFFFKYAKGDLRQKLGNDKTKLMVKYLDYDWSLNRK